MKPVRPAVIHPLGLDGNGVDEDRDIASALDWLAASGPKPEQFWSRLASAHDRYKAFTSNPQHAGKEPAWSDLGPDVVASFLAQGKALLDDRRSCDPSLVSYVAPWLRQLGENLKALHRVHGAVLRSVRMLRTPGVLPDTALFELVMASNYASEGFDVEFIEEGATKTPDLKLSRAGSDELFVELKRLQRGRYEVEERRHHGRIFHELELLIHERDLSVDVDVTYERELSEVPDSYLAQQVERALSSPIVVAGGYPWRDAFGSGIITAAKLAAVRRDTEDSYLYVGPKMARLLAGRTILESNYHLAVKASPNPEDPRYVDRLRYGSVVTWRSMSAAAIDRKARYVRTKLAEADRQIAGHGRGIVHIAMEAELDSDVSDLRRERNLESLKSFRVELQAFIVYLHYLVPRISEHHSWLMDETVDVFSRLDRAPPAFPAFPRAPTVDNDEPAWRQKDAPTG